MTERAYQTRMMESARLQSEALARIEAEQARQAEMFDKIIGLLEAEPTDRSPTKRSPAKS